MGFDTSATLELARWWWTFILRGVVAIIIGVAAFLVPPFGIGLLVGLFAAWALLDGIGSIVVGIRTRRRDRNWWLEIVEGIVGIVAGVIALAFPRFAAQVLVLLIAAWAIVTGIFEIVAAIRLRQEIEGEVWLALAGVASVLFGAMLVLFPAAGALSVAWLIGAGAVVFGAFMIALGLRLRRLQQRAERQLA